LVIDNRKTLHARAAVLGQDRARLLYRIAFHTRRSQ
jgi:alpha-ketoglutarate-dependent taurine dioxygenase